MDNTASAATSEVALHRPVSMEAFETEEEPQNVSELLPADRGKDAWLFLVSGFIIEALIWGFAFSFGVIQEYYSNHEPFAGLDGIATIGSTQTGVMYFIAPVYLGLIVPFPFLRRWFIIGGPVIVAISMIVSSFSNDVPSLIATQGILYALGGGMIHAPTVALTDEWFVQRKGMAFGIMLGGSGAAGVIFPIAISTAMEKFGFRNVLRAYAVIVLVCMIPCMYYIKPRLPASRTRRLDLSFVISPQFMALQLGNIIQGLGLFIPALYLPTYARSLGASYILSALTSVTYNIAVVAGSIVTGLLADRLHVTTVITLGTTLSALAVFLLWGFSANLAILFVFSFCYGFTAGGSSSAWSGVIKLVQQKVRHADSGMVLGFLSAGRGVGNVVSGPISGALLGAGATSWGYGSQYGALIVFTGVTVFCGGVSIFVSSAVSIVAGGTGTDKVCSRDLSQALCDAARTCRLVALRLVSAAPGSRIGPGSRRL